jgi:hypothetical protein
MEKKIMYVGDNLDRGFVSETHDGSRLGLNSMFGNNVLIHTSDKPIESFQIHLGGKDSPCPSVDREKYTLVLNGEPQVKREGDTLIILDNRIKNVIINGVKFENPNI